MRSDQKMLRHIFMVSLFVFLVACGSSPKTDFYMLNTDKEDLRRRLILLQALPLVSGR